MNKYVKCLLFDFFGILFSLLIAGFKFYDFSFVQLDMDSAIFGTLAALFWWCFFDLLVDLLKYFCNRKSSAPADDNN